MIPADEFHALLHRHLPAPLLERVGVAFLVAGQAVRAFCPVNARQLARRKAEDVSLRAAVLTPAADFAADAFGPVTPTWAAGPSFRGWSTTGTAAGSPLKRTPSASRGRREW